jgi:hypothetical protein
LISGTSFFAREAYLFIKFRFLSIFLGKTTIVKNGRSVLITAPSKWQIKENVQRASILGREINPDSALAVIKASYEISFSTLKSSEENTGKFNMSISVSDFKQRHPNLTSKNRTK